jgi:hypothetical protein
MDATDTDDFDAMTTLLECIVDSVDKLDAVVVLYRVRPRPMHTDALARVLALSVESTVEVLSGLQRAGIVRKQTQVDDAGWWFDPACAWATSVEVLIELHDLDRAELLGLMKHVAIESFLSNDLRSSIRNFARRKRDRKPIPMS